MNTERRSGSLDELIKLVTSNKDSEKPLDEPLMINFYPDKTEEVLAFVSEYWLPQVTASPSNTPLENAKNHYVRFNNAPIMSMEKCTISQKMEFQYEGDPLRQPIFAVGLAGGIAILYPSDVVWFRQPDGSECWIRMS